MTSRTAIGAFLAFALFFSSCGHEKTAGRPSVLLITLDTTRADHLGCYGYAKNTSSHIDGIAASGVLFENAFSTSGITPVAHASILTGLYPHHHGLRIMFGSTGYELPDSCETLAEIFRENGWRTGAFVSAYPASEQFGLQQGFETFDSGMSDEMMTREREGQMPVDGIWLDKSEATAQRRADATTDLALSWLDDSDDPFFLWVHYFDPHDPSLVPPAEFLSRFNLDQKPPSPRVVVYDPEITFMDEQIGRILTRIEGDDRLANTAIVIIADHGQGLGDHDWFQHRLLYQEQIHIPFIVRLPGGPEGVRKESMVRNVDLFPTLLEWTGLAHRNTIDGKSLLARIRQSLPIGEAHTEFAYAEALNTLDAYANRRLAEHQRDLLFCVTDGDWKLIHHQGTPANSELYRLSTDTKELVNLAESEPGERDRLLDVLRGMGVMNIESGDPKFEIDEEKRRKLNSLGYIGG